MSNGYTDLRPLTALAWSPARPPAEPGDPDYFDPLNPVGNPFVLEYDVDGDRYQVVSATTGGPAYFNGGGIRMASRDRAHVDEHLAYANDFPRAVEVGPGPAEARRIAAERAAFTRGLAEILATA